MRELATSVRIWLGITTIKGVRKPYLHIINGGSRSTRPSNLENGFPAGLTVPCRDDFSVGPSFKQDWFRSRTRRVGKNAHGGRGAGLEPMKENSKTLRSQLPLKLLKVGTRESTQRLEAKGGFFNDDWPANLEVIGINHQLKDMSISYIPAQRLSCTLRWQHREGYPGRWGLFQGGNGSKLRSHGTGQVVRDPHWKVCPSRDNPTVCMICCISATLLGWSDTNTGRASQA
jgi:hypothetical protein